MYISSLKDLNTIVVIRVIIDSKNLSKIPLYYSTSDESYDYDFLTWFKKICIYPEF